MLNNRHRLATSLCNLLPLLKYFVWTGYNHFHSSQHSKALVDTGSCARLGPQMMCSWGRWKSYLVPVEQDKCTITTLIPTASNMVSIQMFPKSQQKKVQIIESFHCILVRDYTVQDEIRLHMTAKETNTLD